MDQFNEAVFKEISYRNDAIFGNVMSAEEVEIIGTSKISVEEESHEGIKIVLNKDENDNIKEIKFVCTCGETKSVILDYNAE
ncbi:MAG: hypothetical protein KDC52_16945 [Ignavibacteriae bacterium]|nr:hypothetical protein [Ignavibacteriota bacterium]MCB0753162.1 hypothetical protein [Ignavibacteriota bacterium]MCB9248072.1 hypothetical protein [Ignavibacteriales bacterium]